MAAMEAASHHQQQPYPSLPASPTLTNPDMILPDERGSSSDEYEPLDSASHGPMMMWKNAHAATSGASLPQMHVYYNGRTMVGAPAPHAFGPSVPITPTTPIIYGNGTMLSDIGEVTEAESTPGKPASVSSRSKSSGRASSIRKIDSGSDAALRSSPTMGAQTIPKIRSKGNLIGGKQQRERRGSIESNSTITTQDRALFADFDDSVSVGDSVFQGDDEESVADSFTDGPTTLAKELTGELLHPASSRTRDQNTGSGGGVGSGGAGGSNGNEDRLSTYSTTSISRRAEQILATAKKRLTTMEGNLSRARSSLQSSSSYGSDGSTPSPPMIRATSALHPSAAGSGSPQYSPGHARMSSDNALPQSSSAPQIYPQRSASALGAAGGYRQPVSGSRSVEHLRDGFAGHYKRPNHAADHAPLEPLSEDDVLPTPTNTTPSGPSEQDRVGSDGLLSPAVLAPGDRGLNRPASVAQMRDLKDQMKDLKGRISSLREQAQADSLKRRSLQSLRTPSPFTHASIDPWYAEAKQPGDDDDGEIDGARTGPGRNPWNGELSTVDGESQSGAREAKEEDVAEDEADEADEEAPVDEMMEHAKRVSYIRHPLSEQVDSAVLAQAVGPEGENASLGGKADVEDDGSDMETENGDMGGDGIGHFEDAPAVMEESTPEVMQDRAKELHDEGFVDVIDDAYESESGESSYHDTLQHPISHEDREDAFDYEHFFLHSAMGTLSQQRRRGSFSSEDSVETTRGPSTAAAAEAKDGTGDDAAGGSGRARRGSSASTSTFDSFATADEGRSSRSEALDENNRENDEEEEEEEEEEDGGGGGGDQVARVGTMTGVKRPDSTPATRRTVLGPAMGNGYAMDSNVSLRDVLLRRPLSSAATNSLHSVSSFESMGTTRSFPLVNKPAAQTNGDNDNDNNSENDGDTGETDWQRHSLERPGSAASLDSVRHVGNAVPAAAAAAAMQSLAKEDQYLVERLVASLGKCVLGLTESGRASAESRAARRRIDAARKILEGLESP